MSTHPLLNALRTLLFCVECIRFFHMHMPLMTCNIAFSKIPRGNLGAIASGSGKYGGLAGMGMVNRRQVCLDFVFLASNGFLTWQVYPFDNVLRYKGGSLPWLRICTETNYLDGFRIR